MELAREFLILQEEANATLEHLKKNLCDTLLEVSEAAPVEHKYPKENIPSNLPSVPEWWRKARMSHAVQLTVKPCNPSEDQTIRDRAYQICCERCRTLHRRDPEALDKCTF